MNRILPILLFLSAAGVAQAQESQPPANASDDPAAIIALSHELYDEGNSEAFLEILADTFQIDHTMARRFVSTNTASQTAEFVKTAAANGRTVEVLDEMTYGPFVVQKQRITQSGEPSEHLWIYEVEDGKIVNLWHFDAAGVLSAREAED
jgi:hypothetical protein